MEEDNLNDLQKKITSIEQDLKSLSDEIYTNNFSTSQDFQKYSRFNTRIKIPHSASTPATCEVGELVEVGGIAYICSAANTWSKIGLQS